MGRILTVAEHSKMIAASFYLFLVSCSTLGCCGGSRNVHWGLSASPTHTPKRSDVFQTSVFNLGTSARWFPVLLLPVLNNCIIWNGKQKKERIKGGKEEVKKTEGRILKMKYTHCVILSMKYWIVSHNTDNSKLNNTVLDTDSNKKNN